MVFKSSIVELISADFLTMTCINYVVFINCNRLGLLRIQNQF